MIAALKSFFFGEKCSLCNQKMKRTVDEGYINISLDIFLEYECIPCHSYIRARNYKCINRGYALVHNYWLYVHANNPMVGDIYEPMRPEGISYCIGEAPLNGIYVSMEEIDYVNTLVKKHMSLI